MSLGGGSCGRGEGALNKHTRCFSADTSKSSTNFRKTASKTEYIPVFWCVNASMLPCCFLIPFNAEYQTGDCFVFTKYKSHGDRNKKKQKTEQGSSRCLHVFARPWFQRGRVKIKAQISTCHPDVDHLLQTSPPPHCLWEVSGALCRPQYPSILGCRAGTTSSAFLPPFLPCSVPPSISSVPLEKPHSRNAQSVESSGLENNKEKKKN